jgi:ribosomal protein S17
MSKLVRNLKGVQILRRAKQAALPYTVAVGQIVNSPDKTTREVKVLKMQQNEYLKMYFNKSFKFMTVDDKDESRVGDIVLIKKLTNPPTQEKLFGIEKILFQVNNIVDPITGRSNNYESDILKEHMENVIKQTENKKFE